MLIHLSDEIDYENASASIRKNIAFRGTNVFILACAIIIASVGLNVNSIPVIIGEIVICKTSGIEYISVFTVFPYITICFLPDRNLFVGKDMLWKFSHTKIDCKHRYCRVQHCIYILILFRF